MGEAQMADEEPGGGISARVALLLLAALLLIGLVGLVLLGAGPLDTPETESPGAALPFALLTTPLRPRRRR